jgi:hypothetical protein
MISSAYITVFDDFISNLQKFYQPTQLNQKNEKEFFVNVSSTAINQMFHYYNMRSLPLISHELLFKIGNCKSTFFVNAFVEKIKNFIEPNIKRSYDNPLDKLLQVDQQFEN